MKLKRAPAAGPDSQYENRASYRAAEGLGYCESLLYFHGPRLICFFKKHILETYLEEKIICTRCSTVYWDRRTAKDDVLG